MGIDWILSEEMDLAQLLKLQAKDFIKFIQILYCKEIILTYFIRLIGIDLKHREM